MSQPDRTHPAANSVVVTYQVRPRTLILGPVFAEKEQARQLVRDRGVGWSWVEVGFADSEFAGYVVSRPRPWWRRWLRV